MICTVKCKEKKIKEIQYVDREMKGGNCVEQGFGAGAARSRCIWLKPEPEPSLWPGSGTSFNFSFIIHANFVEHNLFIISFIEKIINL